MVPFTYYILGDNEGLPCLSLPTVVLVGAVLRRFGLGVFRVPSFRVIVFWALELEFRACGSDAGLSQ